MDQDPIFSNFRLPAHEVRGAAPAGMRRARAAAGQRPAPSAARRAGACARAAAPPPAARPLHPMSDTPPILMPLSLCCLLFPVPQPGYPGGIFAPFVPGNLEELKVKEIKNGALARLGSRLALVLPTAWRDLGEATDRCAASGGSGADAPAPCPLPPAPCPPAGRLAMLAFIGFTMGAQVTGLNPIAALKQHLANPLGTTIFSKAVVVPGQAVVPPCMIPETVEFQVRRPGCAESGVGCRLRRWLRRCWPAASRAARGRLRRQRWRQSAPTHACCRPHSCRPPLQGITIPAG